MTLNDLQTLIDKGLFHHATYRHHGTIWEGLWIYAKADKGFRGFSPVGSFFKDDPDLDAAHNTVKRSGVSVGAYGQG